MRTIQSTFLAILTIGAGGLATAQASQVAVDIQPQPMRTALKQLGEQAGLQILFRAEDVARDGKATPEVSGKLSAQEALERLLVDSGLKYEFVNERTVRISVPSASDQPMSMEKGRAQAADAVRIAQADAATPQGEPRESMPATTATTDSDPKLDEIVVTAQKREERLINAPISIGVLSGEQLDRGSSRSVADVLNRVPGVTLLEGQPGNTQIAIRGVSAMAGTTTSAYYLDEVPFAFIVNASLPDVNAFDLARVEVLRGPQGTLYGANALSGVVRVLTNKANLNDYEFKGRVRASDTDHGGGNYSGDMALNVPLVPGRLAVRGVASYSDISGFINSTSLTDPGRQINDTQARAYRLKLNYQPTDNLNVDIGYSRSDISSGAPASAEDGLTTPFFAHQPDDRVYDTYNLIAAYDWANVSLLSSTSHVEYQAATLVDQGFQYSNRYKLNSFSQELRLQSRLNGPWQWSTGVYYQDTTDNTLQHVHLSDFPFDYEAQRSAESYAAFGEATRLFGGGRFELTGGLRYYDSKTVLSALSDFFTSTSNLAPSESADADKITGRVVLTYHATDDRILYASLSSGFRSGLPRSQAIAVVDPSFPAVKPDSLESYEVGAKGRWLDGAVTYTSAFYYQKWIDIQQTVILPNAFTAFTNAGNANGLGFEGDLTFHPTRNLTLDASVGWNDLTFDEDVPSGTVILFRAGDRINNSPEWTGTLGGDYRVATSLQRMSAVFATNLTYNSPNTQRSKTGNAVTVSESDAILRWNASIGLEREQWALQLYGDNLLNEDGAISAGLTAGTDFIDIVSIRPRPRTIGLQLTVNY